MADLDNCPNCGKIYVKAFRSICNDCHREVEDKFEVVYRFIRKKENRAASIEEVHAKTEVEKDLLYQFLREGRLHLAQFPNLGYPCDKCGDTIREGRLCNRCSSGIRQDLKTHEDEKAFEARKKETEKAKYQTYHSLDDRFDKD